MSKRCLGCMDLFGDEFSICPHCGYVVGTHAEEAIHMDPGTILHNRYIVGRVLGFGGFGVTYIGWDGKLEQKVAIKEYLPGEFSTRMPGQSQLTVFNGDKSEQFNDGMVKFVEEAKRLAKFQNEPGIVKIFDSFQENDTAYIVMEYLDGETLTSYLKRVGTIPEDQAVAMLMPVMESLQAVHAEGLLHRDIAPDNIFLTKSGEVKLIDFGASRYATTSHSRSLTVIIKPGFSPEEQYRSRGDQGAYTDVYALAATLYKMITGTTPPDAMERRAKYENQNKDILVPMHKMNKSVSVNRENAILNAMNVRIEDRTPDVASFISELNADPPAKRRYGKIKKIDLYAWPLWLKILVPTLLVALITFGVLLITGVISFSRYSTEVVIPDNIVIAPDVEGLGKNEAISSIEGNQLIAIIGGSIESEYISAGRIIMQTPIGGAFLEKNGIVELTICSGKGVEEAVNGVATVPFLIGDTREAAIEKLKQAGLGEPIIKEINDENVAAGLVIDSSIESGEKVDEGTVLTLNVSTGPSSFKMPSVVGNVESDAKSTLGNRGLVVAVEYDKSNTVPEGCVISQSVPENTDVKRGDNVLLVVSSGVKTVEVSNVVGKKQKDAENILKKQGFAVYVRENSSETVPAGVVISQSPAAGTAQKEGSTITIFVSTGKRNIKVSYNANGGTVSKASDTRHTKDAYGEMPTPTRKGYTFKGWFTEASGGTEVTSETVVTAEANHTIYAQWAANSYTVMFDANSGSVSTASKTVTFDAEYGELPNPTKTGYGFDGWFTAANGGTQITSKSKLTTADTVTLYAHWSAGKMTVTLDANGGTVSPGTMTVTYEQAYGTIPQPKRTGYSFGGWYTKADGGTKVEESAIVTASHTIYAHWTALKYTVAFNPNGGSVSTESKEVTYDAKYGTLPTPSLTGYDFNGWFTAASGGNKVQADTKVAITGNQTLYAQWTIAKYTITFNANGGSVSEASRQIEYGKEYGTLPSPSRTGYSFDGWFTAASGGNAVSATTTVQNAHTIYAHWTALKYTVTFNPNGGSVSTNSTQVTYDKTYGNLPTPTLTGYSFNGWFTAKSGGTKITSNTTVKLTANQELFAQWTQLKYKLNFNANGGSVSEASRQLVYNAEYGNLPSPTKDYCNFDGWYTAASGGTKVTSTTKMGTSDVTIYAHWKDKPLSDWVSASSVPSGAKIVERRWKYTRTQTKESTNSSESGWTQTGSYWKKTGSGSTNYATFPSTFDTGNSIYTSFAKGPYTSSETASKKREVKNTWKGYVYWHWMYSVAYANNTQRTISDRYGNFDQYGNSGGYAFYYFSAFTSSTNCPYLDNYYCCSRNQPSYNCNGVIPNTGVTGVGTPRYFRFDYYVSEYTDYQKMYQYKLVTNGYSDTQLSNGGEYSNVEAQVRYRVK